MRHCLSAGRPVLAFRDPVTACICSVVTIVLATGLAACNPFHRGTKLAEEVSLIAVMPIEPVEHASATPTGQETSLPPEAGPEVTAAVYGELSSSSKFRLVPDLAVAQALRRIKPSGDLATRAVALGKDVAADAVLFGTVSRYVEREGSEFGARRPAAVAFALQLVSSRSGKILWSGNFDQAQQALSSNLGNWWQFWRGGPRWFTAQEFTRIGVEHVLKELSRQLG